MATIDEIVTLRANVEAEQAELQKRLDLLATMEGELKKRVSGRCLLGDSWNVARVNGGTAGDRFVVGVSNGYSHVTLLALEDLQAMQVALDAAEAEALTASHLRALAGKQDDPNWPKVDEIPF